MRSRPLHAVLLPVPESGRLVDALAAALDGSGPAVLPLDPDLPQARLDELIAAFAPSAIVTTQGIEPLASADHSPAADGRRGVDDDVAVVLATSGSTGRRKGVELTADALTASARASLRRLGAAPGARWWCCLPTHHISGLGVLVRSMVTGSAPLVSDRVDAEAVVAALAFPGCSYVSLVPTQLRRLLDAGASLASFEAILLGGAAIPASLLADAAEAGVRVVTTYGMTETCGGCVYEGAPLDGVTVGGDVGGLITIGGPVLFSRYRLAPELTRASLRDGQFVTSDLGGLGPDGRLVLRGRADDVINTGGEKVVPGLVEDALRELAPVRDVVVVGVPDAVWGERVTAVLVPAGTAGTAGTAGSADARLGLAQVRSLLRGKLPRYALPRGIVWVPELPMLASGKPDRRRLKALAADAPTSEPR